MAKANALYWKSFERQNSTHLTLFKHQNTKTAHYKLPKIHWVIALFEVFGPVRNQLLVTVSFHHPVNAKKFGQNPKFVQFLLVHVGTP